MNEDSSRCTAFPLSANLSNLRGIVANPRTEEAVATACHEISVSQSYPILYLCKYL